MALFVRTNTNKFFFINNHCNNLTLINTEIRKFSGFIRDSCFFKYCGNVHNTLNFCDVKKTSNCSNAPQRNDTIKNEKSFEKFLSLRKDEAKRSVIIQVQSPDSYSDLYSYCCGFGRIKNSRYYVVSKSSYFIIEFEELSSQQALFNATTHLNYNEIIPVKSQLLWFRNASMNKCEKVLKDMPAPNKSLPISDSVSINTALSNVNSVSEQMKLLYNMSKLDDIGIRLRFLTAYQVEAGFLSLFPNISAFPFGSSVNGFGKNGCDLDLVLYLESNKTEKPDSRLVFHTKSALSDERAQTQRSMETIATVMKEFMPGVLNVRKILRARVPIIKYDNKITGLECDLSMTNMTAVYMSELLFLYGEFYSQVRPLVFSIRQWASSVGITNSTPGMWITNFSLSLLVLFFLQSEQFLPSINRLKNNATKSDIRLTDTCVDCTFIRDITKWPEMRKSNNITLEYLLAGFYNFYAKFDFTTKAISLRDGTTVCKPDASPLYICNPLEKMLNVSKNVNHDELMRFINAVRSAAMLIDEESHERGLLDIFAEKQPRRRQFVVGHPEKKVRIVDIFRSNNDSYKDTAKNVGWTKTRGRQR